MNIFISGGSGFIGNNLIKFLLSKKFKILALSRRKNFSRSRLKFIKGDLNLSVKNFSLIKRFKPKIIVNLAWEGIPNYSSKMLNKNLKDQKIFLSKIKNIKSVQKIIMTGTCLEYENMSYPYKEDKKFKPHSLFPVIKLKLRKYLFDIFKNIEVTWLILFYVYGKGQKKKSLIPYAREQIKKNKVLNIKNLNQKNDYIHVSDVISIIYKNIIKQNGDGGVFNVGTGKSTSNQEILNMLIKKYNKNYNKMNYKNNKKDNQIIVANLSKIKQLYKWKPKIKLKEAISNSWI